MTIFSSMPSAFPTRPRSREPMPARGRRLARPRPAIVRKASADDVARAIQAADEHFMCRALRLAARGQGYVEPNPMVGCMIVIAGKIIGEGWHRRFGGPHAEIEALRRCRVSPRGATAYVTLEPCCHF